MVIDLPKVINLFLILLRRLMWLNAQMRECETGWDKRSKGNERENTMHLSGLEKAC